MAWVMSTEQRGLEGVYIYIGAVKIAEIYMRKSNMKWKFYLRLMQNYVAYNDQESYETFSNALKELHRLLNSPPPEGAKVGVKSRRGLDAASYQRTILRSGGDRQE